MYVDHRWIADNLLSYRVGRIPITSPINFHIQANKECGVLRLAQRDSTLLRLGTVSEQSAFETLRPDAVPFIVTVQTLWLGASSVDEDKALAGQWIIVKLSAHGGAQAIVGLLHVGGRHAQP